MSTFINITHKRPQYSFIGPACIGRRCFHPVLKGGGDGTCNNRMLRGCPDPEPEYDKEAARRNKAAGWRFER